jgi:uncharacterized protein YjbJ (UPF0337 family)
MNDSLRNKIGGTAHEGKGKLKEAAGRATNNPDLADRGTAEKIAGKVQKKAGEVEKVFGN